MLAKPIYINGSSSITAIADEERDANPLLSIDPEFKNHLDAGAARRLSKIIKRSLVASKLCLFDAHLELPDAIITGTGLGCLEDTEKFLNNVLEDELAMLSPTAFIQSTHNTISGQIALMVKCHGYNTTYAHRSLSFEQAVEDALLQLTLGEAKNILVGGADEMPAIPHQIMQKVGLYRSGKQHLPTAGEGVAYFVLSTEKNDCSKTQVVDLATFEGKIDVQKEVAAFLANTGLGHADVDVFLSGNNSSESQDFVYEELKEMLFPDAWHLHYKHLTGEFFTVTALAWDLAVQILSSGKVDSKFVQKSSQRQPKHILLYNHFLNREHSIALLRNV
jgi:3-oxoacyl-[acyl-carrier-protein] synthase II